MRVNSVLGVAAIATCVLAACHHNRNTVSAVGGVAPPAVTTVGTVTIERRPCFGTCPVYTMQIDEAGAIDFNGLRFTSTVGHATDTLPPAAVAALHAAFNREGFASFAPRYMPGEKVCGLAPSDAPTVITSSTSGGVTKTVEHYQGCPDAPAALTRLENQIDSIARVTRWTRGGEK